MSLVIQNRVAPDDPGYFRIGDVVLNIPPEKIHTKRLSNNEETVALRAPHPLHKKTGHERLDVTISWKALADYSRGTADYTQWEQLRRIFAFCKAAPFIQVENKHLREIILKHNPGYKNYDRMAFSLRQLRVDSVPDMTDTYEITLVMSWFHYLPFSLDFGYTGPDGRSVDAHESDDFKIYIDTWISKNLPSDWRRFLADPQFLQIKWRSYDVVRIPEPPSEEDQATPLHVPNVSVPLPTGSIADQITSTANRLGIAPNFALAMASVESSFDQQAISPKGARGIMQMMPIAKKQLRIWAATGAYGIDRSLVNMTDSQIDTDASANIVAGLNYFKGLLGLYAGDYRKALIAYNAGQSYAENPNRPLPEETRNHLEKVFARSVQPLSSGPAKVQPVSYSSTPALPTAVSHENQIPTLGEGWELDHSTERARFHYKENALVCGATTASRLEPVQLSLVLVNNIVAVPRAASRYPAQQHIGSPSTMVEISFLSNGTLEDLEPTHPGASRLAGAIDELDQQFLDLQSEWRAASSIQRMQAMSIDNLFFAMFGITDVLPHHLSTETVAESPNLLDVRFIASDYPNVWEYLEPFRVKQMSGDYAKTWDKVLTGDTLLQDMTQEKRSVLGPLLQFAKDRSASHREEQLENAAKYLKDLGPTNTPFGIELDNTIKTKFRALAAISRTVHAPPTQEYFDIYTAPVAETKPVPASSQIELARRYPEIAQRLDQEVYTYDDYVVLAKDGYFGAHELMGEIRRAIEPQLKEYEAAGNTHPIDAVFQNLFVQQYTKSPAFARAVQDAQENPQLKQTFQALAVESPSHQGKNSRHGAYQDLGLKEIDLTFRDNNPGYYFRNYQEQLKNKLLEHVTPLTKDFATAASTLNTPSGKNIAMSAGADSGLLTNLAEESLRRASVPPLSMSRAFPALKLFFMEQDNTGVYYQYDDFYAHNQVLNVEVMRFQDKPDIAVIQISNSSNLLSHRFFDKTVWGAVEKKLAKFSQERGVAADGSPIITPEGALTHSTANESRSGVDMPDLSKGYKTTGADGKKATIPVSNATLQYFALQPGTKVQLRIGFNNDPDQLFPVFQGRVAEIEYGEILTIICQGYLAELIDSLNPNIEGYTTTYGGSWRPWNEPGDTTSVIAHMLRMSSAKHFGRWQANPTTTPMLSGFTYRPLKLLKTGVTLFDYLLNTLSTGSDRSAINIQISRFLGLRPEYRTDPSVKKDAWAIGRPWNYERPTYTAWSQPIYHIPDNGSVSPWLVMKDIARRYPEQILCVKHYGYPFQADATLVFAHPNDTYVARNTLLNEIELGSSTENPNFEAWWKETGRDQVQALFETFYDGEHVAADILSDQQFWASWPEFMSAKNINKKASQMVLEQIDNGKHKAFREIMAAALRMLNAYSGQPEEDMRLAQLSQAYLVALVLALGRISSNARLTKIKQFRDALLQLQKSLASYQENRNTSTLDSRLKPVRKWHIVATEHIVHNGIILNDKINNAVRIENKVYPASANIPTELQRIVDVTDAILHPSKNCNKPQYQEPYAQSFLKEEIGKMYRGELVLLGMPEIEPFDVILLLDTHRGIHGPVEVESVIHTIDQENGFITVVKPRALVLVNEVMGAGIMSALWSFGAALPGEFSSFAAAFSEEGDPQNNISGMTPEEQLVAKATGTAAGISAYGTTRVINKGLGRAGAWAGNKIAQTEAKGATTAVVKNAAGKVFGARPIFLTLALLTAGAVVKGYSMALQRASMNPLFVLPLSQFQRPWVAGIEGWQISDLAVMTAEGFKRIAAYTVFATIEGYKQALNIADEL